MENLPDTKLTERRFMSFCFTVMKNEISNIRKKEKKYTQWTTQLTHQHQDAKFNGGLDNYIKNTTPFIVDGKKIVVNDYDLARAISTLTKKRQEIILLAYFVGLNDCEIASQKGVTHQTINETRQLSIKQMRKFYKEIIDNE